MTGLLAWLKKWWKWVLAGIAALLAFITGWVTRKPKPGLPILLREKIDAEKKAEESRAKVIADAEAKMAQIVAEAHAAMVGQQGEIKTTTEEIKDDPQKVNDYLHQVGEEMRKP